MYKYETSTPRSSNQNAENDVLIGIFFPVQIPKLYSNILWPWDIFWDMSDIKSLSVEYIAILQIQELWVLIEKRYYENWNFLDYVTCKTISFNLTA